MLAVFERNRMPEALCQEAAFISKGRDLPNTPPSFNTVWFGEGKQTKSDCTGRRQAAAGPGRQHVTLRGAAGEFSLPLFLWKECLLSQP